MADYLQATADLGNFGTSPARIVKTVYMEVDVDPAQQTAEAEYIIALCKQGDNPDDRRRHLGPARFGRFREVHRPLQGQPYIKGVRQVLHGPDTPAGYCLREAVHPRRAACSASRA